MKQTFGIDDYFANSAIQSASASIRSYRELHKLNIDTHKDKKKAIEEKIKKSKKRLTALEKMKGSLINASKQKNPSLIKGTNCERYKDGKFEIICFGKVHKTFDNMYDFEIQYLDPKIKEMKARIRNLGNRLEHEKSVIQRMKEDKDYHICFGTKALFKKQDTVYPDHRTWKQNADMGKKNNQEFVQIPFAKMIEMIEYSANRYGIVFKAA